MLRAQMLFLRGLLLALLLAAQTATLSHAAEHGEEPHEHKEHEGVECQIVVIAAEDVAILPAWILPAFSPATKREIASIIVQSSTWQWPPERGPPPRSPPFDRQ